MKSKNVKWSYELIWLQQQWFMSMSTNTSGRTEMGGWCRYVGEIVVKLGFKEISVMPETNQHTWILRKLDIFRNQWKRDEALLSWQYLYRVDLCVQLTGLQQGRGLILPSTLHPRGPSDISCNADIFISFCYYVCLSIESQISFEGWQTWWSALCHENSCVCVLFVYECVCVILGGM